MSVSKVIEKPEFSRRIFLAHIPESVYVAILALIYYSYLVFDLNYPGDRDIYFHAGIVRKILQEGYVYSLPEMFFTFHADRYVDYHFLFHYLSVPFALVTGDPLTGMRVATICFSALSAGLLHAFFQYYGVNYRSLFTLVYLASSPIFTGRLLFGRGVTLFLALFFAVIISYHRKKKWHIFIISLLAVWTYTGFPLVAVFAIIYIFLIFFRQTDRQEYVYPFYSIAGIISGILFHHAFPYQFNGFYNEYILHFVGSAGLEKIGEWDGPDSNLFVIAVIIPGLVFFISYLLGRDNLRKSFADAIFITAGLFLILSAVYTKLIEYGIPLIVIAGAIMMPQLDERERRVRFLTYSLGIIVIVGVVLFSIPQTIIRNKINGNLNDPSDAKDVAYWLEAKVQPGSKVIAHWPDFPYFFYFAPSLRYPFGMNPVYAYGYDIKKYLNIRAIYDGITSDPEKIMKYMDSRYLVINRKLTPRIDFIMQGKIKSRETPMVYENNSYRVYKIN